MCGPQLTQNRRQHQQCYRYCASARQEGCCICLPSVFCNTACRHVQQNPSKRTPSGPPLLDMNLEASVIQELLVYLLQGWQCIFKILTMMSHFQTSPSHQYLNLKKKNSLDIADANQITFISLCTIFSGFIDWININTVPHCTLAFLAIMQQSGLYRQVFGTMHFRQIITKSAVQGVQNRCISLYYIWQLFLPCQL